MLWLTTSAADLISSDRWWLQFQMATLHYYHAWFREGPRLPDLSLGIETTWWWALASSPYSNKLSQVSCCNCKRVLPSVTKYKYLLTSTYHVWPFVLLKKLKKIIFILLWHVLSSHIFKVYLNCFYFFLNFLNKTNGQTWSANVNKYLYFGTEVVCSRTCSRAH